MRKNISQLRDVLQRGGEFLKQSLDSVKQAIDCGVTAACLLLEDHQAGDQAKTSARIVTEIAPAPILSGKKELSTQELADRWGGSTSSIYEWKTTGGLPFKKRGRLPRFDPIKVDQWKRGVRNYSHARSFVS